jgi:hypothetical protein
MAMFAVLDNDNVVTNVIICESLETAEHVTGCVCVEITEENPAMIGWIYDPQTGTFSPPPEPEEVVDPVA